MRDPVSAGARVLAAQLSCLSNEPAERPGWTAAAMAVWPAVALVADDGFIEQTGDIGSKGAPATVAVHLAALWEDDG